MELAQPLAEVFDTGPSSEDGGGDGGVKWIERDEFQHDPSEKDHLGDGADLARPVGFDWHLVVQIVQNPDTRNNNDIASDHKCGKPDWDLPTLTPWNEGKKYDACEQ